MAHKANDRKMDDKRASSSRNGARKKSFHKIGKIETKNSGTRLMLGKERSMSSDIDSVDWRVGHKKTRYENTYRMDPENEEVFSCSKMEGVMNQILKDIIGKETYDPIKCNNMANTISNRIKDNAKIFPWKRYRFVVTVIIGQNSSASIKVGSRCIWDEQRDNFVTAAYENSTIFAVATCFAVYLD